jgi:hypothetical protein
VEACDIPNKEEIQGNTASKVMFTVFWDNKGVFHTDLLECGITVTSDSHCAMLVKLKEHKKGNAQVLFQMASSCYTTVLSHMSQQTVNRLQKSG